MVQRPTLNFRTASIFYFVPTGGATHWCYTAYYSVRQPKCSNKTHGYTTQHLIVDDTMCATTLDPNTDHK